MKKILILFLICFAQNIFSQIIPKGDPNSITVVAPDSSIITYSDENASDMVYDRSVIEIKPEFPGGTEEFNRFIKENYKTPDEDGLKGKVYVTFIVEKDGSLSDLKVIRDIGYGTGKEAIRVLKKCPKWNPGKQNNKTVRVQYAIPIPINQ